MLHYTYIVLLMNSCFVICNLSEHFDAQFEVLQRSLLELLNPKK
jgi:hypothetical protein